MDTENQSSNEGEASKPNNYRPEDLEILDSLNKLDQKLKTFKILTPIIAILLIVVGLWGFVNQSTNGNNKNQAKTSHLTQKIDSLKKVNQSLKENKEQLKDRLKQKKATLDTLKQAKSREKDSEKAKKNNTYQVSEGDNLWKIAKKFYDNGHKADKIINANQLDSPDLIRVGRTLKIPK